MINDNLAAPAHAATATTAHHGTLAARLRGFGLVGVLATIIICFGSVLLPGLGALLVLAWAWRSRTRWRDIGISKPDSWIGVIALGIFLGVALRMLVKLLILPLLNAPPVNPAFGHLEGNDADLPLAILSMGFLAAFGEEVVMRGFLFERVTRLFGRSVLALAGTLLSTSVIFGIGHYPLQGVVGAQHAAIMGLIFGLLYLWSGRLWLPIITHGAFNLAGVAIIYFGVGPEIDAWFWGK